MKTRSGYKIDRTVAPRKIYYESGAVYTEFTTTSKNSFGDAITFIVQGDKTPDQVEVMPDEIIHNSTVQPKEPRPQEIIIKMFLGIMKGMGGIS